MQKLNKFAVGVKTALLIGAFSTFSGVLSAEAEEAVNENTAVEIEEVEESEELMTITGSRIRKSEFSNASPIQIISGDISRELGLFDAGEMLQNTNQASGYQIDNTFGGYVLDNGPGAATIGFRGLGAERTLVLINGRRMAPAGVGGAPTSPDLNLIPGVMIDRIENLYDGASTVYGSDAVAGVANLILRKDVEGFEVQASMNQPKGGGGEEGVLSGMWGTTTDRGFITVGAEYTERKAQSYAQNPFVKGCEERIFETDSGEIITRNSGNGPTIGGEDSCDIFPLTNRIQVDNAFWGSLYSTPGFTNTGIPGFSETTVPAAYIGLLPTWIAADFDGDGIPDGAIVDGNGDGLRDVDFQDPRYAYQQSDYYKSGDYLSQNKRISVVMNGEYNLQDSNDTTLYFDGLYAKRDSDIFAPGAQLFEWVPPSNPYNPCNVNEVNGTDCYGVLGFGNDGSKWVRPIINIRGDRDQHKIDVSQYRIVTGITGDIGPLANDNWFYDAYVSYSASKGNYVTTGISEERLQNSIYTSVRNTDGSVSCGDGTDGCVPVNLFGDNIFQVGGGTLTPEEAAYVMVDRIARTDVSQLVVNGYASGDVFELPWNGAVVSGVVGLEYRRDEIKTDSNDVATEGLLWGWFADQGAVGARNLKEAFTEIEFPLLSGITGVEELSITAAGRITKESYYDTESTYSVKMIYRPIEWFTLRGTKGTSYRAPNLRERFLLGTSGFATVSDPCVVPTDARTSDIANPSAPDGYDPTLDQRDSSTIAACAAAGVDPTTLGLGQNGTNKFNTGYSAEVTTGGTTALTEETSEAETFGFIFEQPFTDEFDLTVSMTAFDIEVTNSIAEPSAGYSINQCYSADGNSAFCSRLVRDTDGQLSDIDASFINIGLLTSKGIDYNLYYQQDFVVLEKNLSVSLDLQATRMDESVYDVLGTVDDNVGEPDVPKWRSSARLSLTYDDFRLNWSTRFIGGGEEDDQDDFEAGTAACRGLYDAAGDPLLCRPVGHTEDYTLHNVSLTWSLDDLYINFGVRNVLNEAPPKVDPNGSWSNTNIPLGVGYDTFGRTPYINATYTF